MGGLIVGPEVHAKIVHEISRKVDSSCTKKSEELAIKKKILMVTNK